MSLIIQPKNHQSLTFWLSQKIKDLPASFLEKYIIEPEYRHARFYDRCLDEIAAMDLMLPEGTLTTYEGLADIRVTLDQYVVDNGPAFELMLALDDEIRWTQGGVLLDAIESYATQSKRDWAAKRTYKVLAILPSLRSTQPDDEQLYSVWATWISRAPVWWTEQRLFTAVMEAALTDADALVVSNDVYTALASVMYEAAMRVHNSPLAAGSALRQLAETFGQGDIRADLPIIIVPDDESAYGYQEFATELLDGASGPHYDRAFEYNDSRTGPTYYQPFQPRSPYGATRNLLLH